MRDFTLNMNHNQADAITHDDGSLLLLAGAGSGKTRVITHRFAHLLTKHNLRVDNILCVTFTNKAANEMKERISTLLDYHDDDLNVFTFHSLCAHILKKYAYKLNYNNNFTIYDQKDMYSAITDITSKKYPNVDVKDIIKFIFNGKETKLFTDKYLNANTFKCSNVDTSIALDIYNEYMNLLFEVNAMDFYDLINNTIDLLSMYPEVKNYYVSKWKYIMTDEFQDTNTSQYELLKLLTTTNDNVCVVGDDDQSIYGWRGANVENLKLFKNDFNAKTIKLETNYRSDGYILESANSIVKHINDRISKKMKPDKAFVNKINISSFNTESEQAEFICKEIQRYIALGFKYSDCAILYRINSQSKLVEEILRKYNIPYNLNEQDRLYDKPELKLLISYLKLLYNPNDRDAFLKIINNPKRSLGNKSIDQLLTYHSNNKHLNYIELLNEDIPKFRAIKVIKKLYNILSSIDLSMSIKNIIAELIESLKYKEYLLNEYGSFDYNIKLVTLNDLLSAIELFEKINDSVTLEMFLTEISLLSSKISNHIFNSNKLSLMTIHSSKGLEFPIVFVVGCNDGLIPLYTAKTVSEIDEERRLLYVAMTRAMNNLYLLWFKTKVIGNKIITQDISPLINDISLRCSIHNTTSLGNLNVNKFKIEPTKVYTSENTSNGLSVGDKINHKKYGEGIIEGIYGPIFKIKFKFSTQNVFVTELTQ